MSIFILVGKYNIKNSLLVLSCLSVISHVANPEPLNYKFDTKKFYNICRHITI